MDRERRQRVEDLFHTALERDAASRGAWLRQACGGDDDLCREVEGLLGHAGRAGQFLEEAVIDIAARQLTSSPQPDPLLGTQIGPYLITGLLGEGGMGRVFQAPDTQLNRT